MPALQGGETLLPMGAKCSQALHLSLLVKGEGSSICNILCRPLLDAPVPMLQLVTLAHEGQPARLCKVCSQLQGPWTRDW